MLLLTGLDSNAIENIEKGVHAGGATLQVRMLPVLHFFFDGRVCSACLTPRFFRALQCLKMCCKDGWHTFMWNALRHTHVCSKRLSALLSTLLPRHRSNQEQLVNTPAAASSDVPLLCLPMHSAGLAQVCAGQG